MERLLRFSVLVPYYVPFNTTELTIITLALLPPTPPLTEWGGYMKTRFLTDFGKPDLSPIRKTRSEPLPENQFQLVFTLGRKNTVRAEHPAGGGWA